MPVSITLTNMQILTKYEREKIEYYLKLKLSHHEIGNRLKRNQSDISREISRNKGPDSKYHAALTPKKTDYKSHKTNKRKRISSESNHRIIPSRIS